VSDFRKNSPIIKKFLDIYPKGVYNISEVNTMCKDGKCTNKTKERTQQEKKDLIIRLNKIAGQINGIKGMIENDRYCGDILIQVAAVDKSLKSFGNKMLKNHLETCVVKEIKEGNNEILDEVMDLFSRLS